MDNPLVGAMTLVGVCFQLFRNTLVSGLVSQRVGRGNNSLVGASACLSDVIRFKNNVKSYSYQYIQVYAFPSF